MKPDSLRMHLIRALIVAASDTTLNATAILSLEQEEPVSMGQEGAPPSHTYLALRQLGLVRRRPDRTDSPSHGL